jgi:predicted DNA-binding transcriptional regulator YafY
MDTVNGATQLRRVIRLIRLLSGPPRTLYQLAERLGVSDRTIQRDIKLLQSVGYRIESIERPRKAPVRRITRRPRWSI